MVAMLGLLVGVLGCPVGAAAQGDDAAFPPHRVAGNLYYVGSRDLACYLVATDRGHILINSGFAETVPLIRDAVKKLGFKFEDIKILLGSHAHNDHVAGHALVRKLTGASVRVMEGDEGIIRTGGKGDFQYDSAWEPCPVDQVLKDGDTVKLGGSTLTAVKTAGHTRGCTTWTMTVTEGDRKLLAVVVGSPNVNPGYRLVDNPKYPSIATDYAKTFKALLALPCDLFLGAHGNYYNLAEKHSRLTAGARENPFIDPAGYRRYITERQAAFQAELDRQNKAR